MSNKGYILIHILWVSVLAVFFYLAMTGVITPQTL